MFERIFSYVGSLTAIAMTGVSFAIRDPLDVLTLPGGALILLGAHVVTRGEGGDFRDWDGRTPGQGACGDGSRSEADATSVVSFLFLVISAERNLEIGPSSYADMKETRGVSISIAQGALPRSAGEWNCQFRDRELV